MNRQTSTKSANSQLVNPEEPEKQRNNETIKQIDRDRHESIKNKVRIFGGNKNPTTGGQQANRNSTKSYSKFR
jgi:hypothetical protein